MYKLIKINLQTIKNPPDIYYMISGFNFLLDSH
jgi:hypothetical protein